MKSAKDTSISTGLVALGFFLWAKKTGSLDSLPLIGPFFWPTSVPGSVSAWRDTVNENIGPDGFAHLVMAIIWQESNGVHFLSDGSVIRGADAEIGLCQILPATGAGLGYSELDLMDPVKNIQACHDYILEAYDAWSDWYAANPDQGVPALHDLCRYYNGGPRVVNDHDRYIDLSRGYADQVIHKFELLIKEIA